MAQILFRVGGCHNAWRAGCRLRKRGRYGIWRREDGGAGRQGHLQFARYTRSAQAGNAGAECAATRAWAGRASTSAMDGHNPAAEPAGRGYTAEAGRVRQLVLRHHRRLWLEDAVTRRGYAALPALARNRGGNCGVRFSAGRGRYTEARAANCRSRRGAITQRDRDSRRIGPANRTMVNAGVVNGGSHIFRPPLLGESFAVFGQIPRFQNPFKYTRKFHINRKSAHLTLPRGSRASSFLL